MNDQSELVIVPSAVPPDTCSRWLGLIEAAYRRIEVEVAPGSGFVPESSSFRLGSIGALAVLDVWSALGDHVGERCVDVLGPSLAIDSDQCWVRRQYPPASAPARHRPHSWHQDGALGFAFAPSGDRPIPDALLRMVTCWIALSPCGVGAPGLELVTDRVDHVLPPAQLAEDAVDRRWPAARRTRPTLEAGDVLVFGGDVLHRTHVTAAMTQTRTSIEVRCFPANEIPERIAGDEFVSVPSSRDGPLGAKSPCDGQNRARAGSLGSIWVVALPKSNPHGWG